MLGGSPNATQPGPGTRLGLALRIPLFTSVSTALAVGAHLLGGGAAPGWGQLGLVVVAVALAWRVTARTELSLPRLVAGLLCTQAGVHVALSAPVAAPPPTDAAASCETAYTVHAAGLTDVTHLAGLAQPSLLMSLTHVLAAVAVAWWLRRGEAALWRTVRRAVTALVRAAAGPAGLTHTPARPAHRDVTPAPEGPLVLLGPRWRGPPRHGTGLAHLLLAARPAS